MSDGQTPVKKCPDCGETKPVEQFGLNKRMPDGRARYCRACFAARSQASYRKRRAAQGKPVRERVEVPDGFKFCPRCEQLKPVAEFGRNGAKKSGLTSYCRPCHNVAMAEIKVRNHGSTRSYHLKRRYGLTAAEVDALLVRQGGVCVICLRAEAAHVDHNHETGLFRGLLCFGCNGALGQFLDEPRRLRQAADYLEDRLWYVGHLRIDLDGSGLEMPLPRLEGGGGRRGSRRFRVKERFRLGDPYIRRMIELQKGLCLVCLDDEARHIDHDHQTGKVRGILCPGCNTGMGQLGDDPIALRRAADYLSDVLIRPRPAAGGGTRLSFTIPDVDPATVPPGGWEPYRTRDGLARRAIWDLRDDTVFLRHLAVEVAETYPHVPVAG